MKNIISILTFRIGVDILGFPLQWNHIVCYMTRKSFIRKTNIIETEQYLTKQF